MEPLVSVVEMGAAEHEAASRGLTSAALMQLAGRGAALALLAEPNGAGRRYLVLAGPGNNGGDAMVVAGLLAAAGAPVQIVTFRRSTASPVDPIGIPRFDLADDPDGERLRGALSRCDVVVDGILGTGRARPIESDLAGLLREVRDAANHPHVAALDLPTGVNADNGAADAHALRADETLCFGYYKRGLRGSPGRELAGTVRLIDIGLPNPPKVPIVAWEPAKTDIAAWLPVRSRTVQKFSAGAVLAVAGSPLYVGAPLLCTTGALRAGAGYATLAINEATRAALAGRLVETTMMTIPDRAESAVAYLHENSARYQALLIGPGLGREAETIDLVRGMVANPPSGPRAAVIDADALYALSQTKHWWEKAPLPLVLTPHVGEMSRLCGVKADQIENNRLEIAREWANTWGQVLILKGAPTVVAAPSGELRINPTGNPLLATAGSGDVLSGIVAALLAGGVAPFDAATAAVYVHGLAADLAIDTYGDRGMLAGDLLGFIPLAIKRILGT
jgi:hydroxyethylthiazole kinase-like uncharacterized protein yjeF